MDATAYFSAGTYRFLTTTDDGIRAWVDDQIVIDGWRVQPPTNYYGDKALAEGYHTVRAEYYEETGNAEVKVSGCGYKAANKEMSRVLGSPFLFISEK
ncbi:MAG: PA14 domain-containing protein [Caldilineaceae bacterium]